MHRGSNHLIGALNFVTFLLSIPIIASSIYLSTRATSTDCLTFLQWPLLALGLAVAAVSLAGLAGACYRNALLMRLYLLAMFLAIAALLAFVVFAYVVTDRGSGRAVVNRVYRDYYLEDYSGWLRSRVEGGGYWGRVGSCVVESGVCGRVGRTVNGGVPESADRFYGRELTPMQSGCCKPPTECGMVYVNETMWDQGGAGVVGSNLDCSRWSNDQAQLCYSCDSCKAGVLASIKKSWRKVSIINIVILIILVIVYIVACAASRNNRRMDNDESFGEARMTKSQPSMIQF